MVLILLFPPVLLEPVNQLLERCMVLLMEVESLRSYFDELFDNSLLWNVSKYNVLRVGWQDSESIRNSSGILFLLFFKLRL